MFYKCIKFQQNRFNSVQLTERPRIYIYLCYKGNNLKNIHVSVMVLLHDKGNNLKNTHARLTVLVHDTSSQCALQMYKVSLKYL